MWVKINKGGEAKYVEATVKDYKVKNGDKVYTYVTKDGQTLENQSGEDVFGNKDWIPADFSGSGKYMQSNDKLVKEYYATSGGQGDAFQRKETALIHGFIDMPGTKAYKEYSGAPKGVDSESSANEGEAPAAETTTSTSGKSGGN